jgi:DNA-binding NarL/FixJ family response regulator
VPNPPIPFALIEDHPALRAALSEYLCAQPELHCVLVAESVEEFLDGLPKLSLLPSLVLSDIELPGRSGIEGVRLIRERLPDAQVLMLSAYSDAARVVEAISAGAVGYLVKSTPLPQLKQALLDVLEGGSPMSPGVARHIIERMQPARVAGGSKAAEALTARELEVVRCVEEGLPYKLVGEKLFISVDTVRNHIQAIYRKLEIKSKGELLALAIRRK